MSKWKPLLVAVLFAACPLVRAADTDAPELDTRIGHYYISYHINADATHEETHDWTTTVLKERALAGVKNYSFSYSTSIQKADILHAYTLKADGRRIEVPKTNYQVEVNSGKDKDSPVFSDYTTMTVVFPDLAVGDTIALAYKITETEAMFPGQISVMNGFSRLRAYDDVKVDVDAPAGLKARYVARDMAEQRSEKDGRLHIAWTFQNKQPLKSKRQDWSVYDIEQEPGYALSTFESYAAIAEAYALRARPKAAVTERAQQLADEITKGRKTAREQARALYDWVATHITYAGNCIGVGAVVPHDLSFILDNRMGDCKDHATLLQALLAAKGIASTQALINAGSLYRLPKVPVVSSVNHVINYLPDLKLFADSTSSTTPFGMLPRSIIGKPVLLVDGYQDGMTTPVPPVGSNRQQLRSFVKIAADSSARGEIEVTLSGIFAESARAGLRRMTKDQIDESIENAFRGMGFVGKGKATIDDPQELLDHYHYKVKFELKELMPLPGPSAFYLFPLLPTQAPVYQFIGPATAQLDDVDTACWSATSVEELNYEFPRNMKILSIPDDMKAANDFLSYQASYRLRGNKLTVKRGFDDRTALAVCPPAMASAYQQFAAKVAKNVKAQVIYK